MGVGSNKRAVAKAQDKTPATESMSTPQRTRRAANRAPKSSESPYTTPKSSSKQGSGFTSKLPTDQQRRSNGRQTGRNLIIWSRPRMAEKLLLNIHYECSRHKIALPWDEIAHRLRPGSSGQAVLQHINRLRKDIQVEGHLVPPIPSRLASSRALDNKIRGYIRDEESEDADANGIRAVRFGEHLDDRKFGIPGAYVEDYGDVDGAEMDTNMNTPKRTVKNESPKSPTPSGRKHPFADAGLREMKSSPYGKAKAHDRIYPFPPGTDDEYPLDNHMLDSMYHSPEVMRGRGYLRGYQPDCPPVPRGGFFQGAGFDPSYEHYRPAPMSADRPRHPAFTQGADPFFGAEPLRQPAMEQGMDFNVDFTNVPNNLFSIPGVPGDDPASMARMPQQTGRAETLSSSGTHSQSSGTSVEDFVKSIPQAAGESIDSIKPIDLEKIPKSA